MVSLAGHQLMQAHKKLNGADAERCAQAACQMAGKLTSKQDKITQSNKKTPSELPAPLPKPNVRQTSRSKKYKKRKCGMIGTEAAEASEQDAIRTRHIQRRQKELWKSKER